MIESYDFGEILIDGRRYTSDVIVFHDHVKADWWRREGHRLSAEDLEEAMREKLNVIVIGTGYSGLMRVPAETKTFVESKGVELITQKTADACKTFNRLATSGRKVVAALHLTC